MARNMSFFLTQEQIIRQKKTVTRRFSWWYAKPGWEIQPVVKCQGLKKGEKIEKLGGLIELISVSGERLNEITQKDVIKEGFFHWTPKQFIEFLVTHYKISDNEIVNRIEFIYL